jgi:hypothetical protein
MSSTTQIEQSTTVFTLENVKTQLFLMQFASRAKSSPLPSKRVHFAQSVSRAFRDLDRLSKMVLKETVEEPSEPRIKKVKSPSMIRRAEKRAVLAEAFAEIPRDHRPTFSKIKHLVERRVVSHIVTDLTTGMVSRISLARSATSESGTEWNRDLQPDESLFDHEEQARLASLDARGPPPGEPSLATSASLVYGSGISLLHRFGGMAENVVGLGSGTALVGASGAALATPALAATGIGLPISVGTGLVAGGLGFVGVSGLLLGRGIRAAREYARLEISNEIEVAQDHFANRLQAGARFRQRLGHLIDW